MPGRACPAAGAVASGPGTDLAVAEAVHHVEFARTPTRSLGRLWVLHRRGRPGKDVQEVRGVLHRVSAPGNGDVCPADVRLPEAVDPYAGGGHAASGGHGLTEPLRAAACPVTRFVATAPSGRPRESASRVSRPCPLRHSACRTFEPHVVSLRGTTDPPGRTGTGTARFSPGNPVAASAPETSPLGRAAGSPGLVHGMRRGRWIRVVSEGP